MLSLLLAPALALAPPDEKADARCAAIMRAYLGSFKEDSWDDDKVSGVSLMMFYLGKLAVSHDGAAIKLLVEAQRQAIGKLTEAEIRPIVDKCHDEMSALGKATGI